MIETITKLLQEKMHFSNINKLFIFGAGDFGKRVSQYFIEKKIPIHNIIDNDENKSSDLVNDIPIISWKEFKSKGFVNYEIIICSTYSKEIEKQLLKENIDNFTVFPISLLPCLNFETYYNENIPRFEKFISYLDQISQKTLKSVIDCRRTGDFSLLNISDYNQYIHPKVSPKEGDTIIDGGAFIGDTIEQFNNFLNANCTIHSFEPTTENFSHLLNTIDKYNYKNVIANNLGLDKTKNELQIYFSHEEPAGSFLSQNGDESIKVIDIDSYVEESSIESVDLIKLDIEGFELNALRGAKQTITKFKPKLQICIYHSMEDLIEIFEYISSEWDYEFYVGHHSDVLWETVLYATSKK